MDAVDQKPYRDHHKYNLILLQFANSVYMHIYVCCVRSFFWIVQEHAEIEGVILTVKYELIMNQHLIQILISPVYTSIIQCMSCFCVLIALEYNRNSAAE